MALPSPIHIRASTACISPNLHNATRVLSMLIYETGFSYLKMGRAAAISAVLFAIMMVFTFLQMRFYMGREEAYIR